MEESKETRQTDPAAETEEYTPRPVWQVWGARAAVVIFIILVIVQILSIARGGL